MKLPFIESYEMLLGACTHEFIENYSNELDEIMIDSLITEYNSWNKLRKKYTVDIIDKSKAIWDKYKPKYLKRYYDIIDSDYDCKNELNISINRDQEICEWLANDVYFRGKVDRLEIFNNNKEMIIIDYKTGNSTPDDLQIKIYAWLLSLIYKDAVLFNVIIENVVTLKSYYFHFRKDDIKDFKNIVFNLTDQIDNDKEFNIKPSKLCSYCCYSNKCLEDCKNNNIKNLPSNNILSEKEAIEAVNYLFILDSERESIKAKLKDYYKEKGEIKLDNGIYRQKAIYENKIIDKYTFKERLNENGYDYTDYSNISLSEIKKNKKLYELISDLIEPVLKYNTMEFVPYKNEDEEENNNDN
jgi:hypothetical protein